MFDDLIQRLHRYSENVVAYKLDADFASAVQEAADAIEKLQKAVLRLEEASGILDELPMVDQREPPKEE